MGDLTIHPLFLSGTIPLRLFQDLPPVQQYLQHSPMSDDSHLLIIRFLINEQGILTGAISAVELTDDDIRRHQGFVCFISDFLDELGGYIRPLVANLCNETQRELHVAAEELSRCQSTFSMINTLRESLHHE